MKFKQDLLPNFSSERVKYIYNLSSSRDPIPQSHHTGTQNLPFFLFPLLSAPSPSPNPTTQRYSSNPLILSLSLSQPPFSPSKVKPYIYLHRWFRVSGWWEKWNYCMICHSGDLVCLLLDLCNLTIHLPPSFTARSRKL